MKMAYATTTQLNNEIAARKAADTTEANARTAAVNSLDARLAAVEAWIAAQSAQPTFGSRPASPALNIVGGHDVEISGKTFQATPATAAAVRLEGCVNVWVHDIDIVDPLWHGIDVLTCSGSIRIEGVRYRNVVRNFVQFDKTVASGHIANCRGKGGQTEDIVSMYASGGTSATDLYAIEDCSFEGVDWTSGSGSGFMLADNGGGHIVARRNSLLSPGQVGIGISGGVDCHVTDNLVYGTQRPSSNVGIYTPYVAGVPNPGGHEVARNRVFWLRADGVANPAWDGGASGVIAGWTTNVWQDATLDPATMAVTL